MTAFEENNALENLLADITSDEDDITEYTSNENVEHTSSDEGEEEEEAERETQVRRRIQRKRGML
ncbi:hypothetical protein TSAR_004320 [Trichomalopsis sarcophagae]|uniref:Uncharacterized protein n=1 Tax=Trichomalopsis sarcophagae TaxID=543379 RepID=A0A232EIG3_9HYME|nr:hypothetical protein TSAR_004320 [Trichomalopsis sarcophagae]